MPLISTYYAIYEHRNGERHVRYMGPDVEQALDAYVSLGGSIQEGKRAWVQKTLNGETRTTDNFPASPDYTSGRGQLFLTISREIMTEEQRWAAECKHRQSSALAQGIVANDVSQMRRRKRP